jgi:hypothetical protein
MVEALPFRHAKVVVGLDWEWGSIVRVVAPPRLPHERGDQRPGTGPPAPSGVEVLGYHRQPRCRRDRPEQCPSRHLGRLGCYLSQKSHPITSLASRSRSGCLTCREPEHEWEEGLPPEGLWEMVRHVDSPWHAVIASRLVPTGRPVWNAAEICGWKSGYCCS